MRAAREKLLCWLRHCAPYMECRCSIPAAISLTSAPRCIRTSGTFSILWRTGKMSSSSLQPGTLSVSHQLRKHDASC